MMPKTAVYVRALSIVIGILWLVQPAISQEMRLNEKEIEPLVVEWNYANNSRSRKSFQNVYGDQLLFYTERVSASEAILLKQKLFQSKPDFKQRLASPVTYTPFTLGVIKCEFKKAVWEKDRWKSYDAYLLMSYEQGRYWIVGESDNATDKALKFKLEIGQPILLSTDSVKDEKDSATANITNENNLDTASIYRLNPGVSKGVAGYLSSDKVISVPRKQIFLLMGMMLMGALLIFIADTIQRRRSDRIKNRGRGEEGVDEQEQLKVQSKFENFVITLFDPLYFNFRRSKTENVLDGNSQKTDVVPYLEFEFNRQELRVKFAVICIYHPAMLKGETKIFPARELDYVANLNASGNQNVYFALGFGGTPDDPKQFYFVPAKLVKNETVSPVMLEPYRKSGMFYFNEQSGRLH